MKYIVAGVGNWNRQIFLEKKNQFVGDWRFVDSPEGLLNVLNSFQPRYIFFPHWRWIVTEDILNQYECICFHMTDLPYGRGGSPLQNLIIRGHKDTMLSAIRMEKGLDTGPIYAKLPLKLYGTAQEIYIRATYLIWDLINKFINEKLNPIPQTGEVITFKRRKPDESLLPKSEDLEKIYDYIRMLDADGYPLAFINHENYKIQFSKAKIENGKLVATAEFILHPKL